MAPLFAVRHFAERLCGAALSDLTACPLSHRAACEMLTDVTTQQRPIAKSERPQLLRDGCHAFFSIAPLVVICIVLGGILVGCSVQPRPERPQQGPPPTIDAAAALQADAAELGFPIRLPQLPKDWQATSAKRGSRDRASMSMLDYLTPSGMRMSLVQSDADERDLVEYLDTSDTFERALRPADEEYVDGVVWRVYKGEVHKEPVWTTQLNGPTGPAQIAITGAAGTDEYRTLAAAIQSQPPLAVR